MKNKENDSVHAYKAATGPKLFKKIARYKKKKATRALGPLSRPAPQPSPPFLRKGGRRAGDFFYIYIKLIKKIFFL